MMNDLFNFNVGKIPQPDLPDEKRLIENVNRHIQAMPESTTGGRVVIEASAEWQQGMLKIATCAWRAMGKMTDAFSGEVKEEFKGIAKPVEGILRGLEEMGFEIKDHTGAPYNEGQYLKVIVTEPTPGVSKPKVKETYKPTIYFQTKILQLGEVVVAIPPTENSNNQ